MIQKLGKYAIVEKLGEGSMGAVYKAYDSVLDRHVAIKIMADDIQWNPELKLRFYREARSAATIHHPNIVTIHDLGEEGKITYIVMELLQGTDLKYIIRNKVSLPLEEKISIIAQVADGLNHAHLHGVIHRDIKPGNIHFGPTGNAKILDFGIAHIPASDLTQMGARLGTPVYMSPEQIRGEEYDARSDIFSTGVVFYELVTYIHPFRDKTISKTLENIRSLSQFPFEEQFPEAPSGLWPILSSCLAKDPRMRFDSMADLSRTCRDLLDELTLARQRLSSDLEAALPLLAQKNKLPSAPPRLAELFKDVQKLLRKKEKSDYLSLLHLWKALAPELEWAKKERHRDQAVNVRAKSLTGSGLPNIADVSGQTRSLETTSPTSNGPAATLPARKSEIRAPDIEESSQQKVTILLQRAEDLLTKQDFDAAEFEVDQALKVIAEQPKALQCLKRIRQAREEKQRIQKILQIVADAEQALARGNLEQAEAWLRRALELDPRNDRVKDLQLRLGHAHEKHKADQSHTLFEQARTAFAMGDFLKAKTYAQGVLLVDAQNKKARSLLKEIGSTSRAKDEEQKREQKGRTQTSPSAATLNGPKSDPRADSTIIMGDSGRRKVQRILVWAGISVVLVGVAFGVLYLRQQRIAPKPPLDVATQIIAAKSKLSQNQYDHAIEIAQAVLSLSPGDSQAQAILSEAQRLKRQAKIDILMVEAQALRSQSRLKDANETIQKVLDIDVTNASALAVRSQIEAEISASKSNEEQDSRIQIWLANADSFLNAGKFPEARNEIDKVAQLRPDTQQLEALRKRLNDKTTGAVRNQQKEQQQRIIDDLSRKAQELYRQGKYNEAKDPIAQWLAMAPKSKEGQNLHTQTLEALAALRIYDDCLAAKDYDGALGAVSRLEKGSPSDPNIAELRRRVDVKKAAAKATISIYRMGEPGVLTLDGQQIGMGGEVENKVISASRHKIEVRGSSAKQGSLETVLLDGQELTIVYDSTTSELRQMTTADREALTRRRQREEMHRFPVEHLHGFLKGKCNGELVISGVWVDYKPKEGDHGFSLPFRNSKLTVREERLDFTESSTDEQYQFRARDAKQAGDIKRLWEDLRRMGK